jgi:hypothetical protein
MCNKTRLDAHVLADDGGHACTDVATLNTDERASHNAYNVLKTIANRRLFRKLQNPPSSDITSIWTGWNFGSAMAEEKLNGQQKRHYYVVAFAFALGIDLVTSFLRDAPYKPSLVGLAIMIAAVLYFAVSWIRER